MRKVFLPIMCCITLLCAGEGEILGFSKIALVEKSAEEIELENQNEILRMQIENRKLQKELEALEKVKSAKDAKNKGKNQKQAKARKARDEVSRFKSGFFLGIEGELSMMSLDTNWYPLYASGYYPNNNEDFQLLFLMNLNLGYQHYFVANHGLRVSSSIGSGTPFSSTSEILFTQNTEIKFFQVQTSIIPLKFGFELDYLWDFFNRGKHSLGLNLGIGYEFNFWFVDGKSQTHYMFNAITLSHNLYPKIGFHYYYGKHQFSLEYKFGGIIPGTMGYLSDYSIQNTQMEQRIYGGPSLIAFGYNYRF